MLKDIHTLSTGLRNLWHEICCHAEAGYATFVMVFALSLKAVLNGALERTRGVSLRSLWQRHRAGLLSDCQQQGGLPHAIEK